MLPRPAPVVKERWGPGLDVTEQVQYHYNQDYYHHYGDETPAPHAQPPRARLNQPSEKPREQYQRD